MKRITAIILAALATLTLSACSNDEPKDNSNNSNNSVNSTPTENSSSSEEQTNSEPAGSAYADPAAVLEAVWGAYPEGDKFPIMGGSTDVAMDYDGKPGPFTLTMTDEMKSSLKVTDSIIPQIKSVASMIHMMNANTFTCAAFEVDGDINAFSTALVDSVNSTHWMCGIPETVITVKTGNYLIMAFGNGEVMEKFKTAATAADGASIVHEGPISLGGGGGIALPV
ncbi:MAG: hypothetical protein J1F03_10495 [Oscillospiraceae bacterium]|nr:hypothetical protein [Oscillospiraceae bacterium]